MTVTNLGLNLPTQGDPTVRNNWANAVCIPDYEILDSYTSSPLTKSVAGSANVVLGMGTGSVGDAQHTHFIFTGALTGNINVLWPVGHTFKFTAENQTTGSFSLSIGADNGSGVPAGAVVALPVGGGVLEFYSDGTNVKAVSPPLPVIATGKMLANESGSSAIPTATDIPTQHRVVITATQPFTIPANATANTVFTFRMAGAGGGGGGAQSPNAQAGPGAAGACGEVSFSGFTPSTNVTVTIGPAGTAGSSAGGNGGTGGTTSLTYSAVVIASATGGTGGGGYTGTFPCTAGVAGTFSSTVAGTALTLVSSTALLSTTPNFTGAFYASDAGGNTALGAGGAGVLNNANGRAGVRGGGGGAAYSGNSTARSGGLGGAGEVIAEWVL